MKTQTVEIPYGTIFIMPINHWLGDDFMIWIDITPKRYYGLAMIPINNVIEDLFRDQWLNRSNGVSPTNYRNDIVYMATRFLKGCKVVDNSLVIENWTHLPHLTSNAYISMARLILTAIDHWYTEAENEMYAENHTIDDWGW